MSWLEPLVPLSNVRYFQTFNGLWKGKKGPFATAGVIRNTNFTSMGRVDHSDVAYLKVEQKQLNTRQLQRGDIILERSGGGPKQPVGRVVYFDGATGVFSLSNFTSAIRVTDKQSFDPEFVLYALMNLYQSGATESLQSQTTGIRNLDFTAYKERARIPLIPLAEQRQIAAVLNLVQRAIEQQERLIALTTELKQALMHKLFTEGLHGEPQKMTEIGPVPESWKTLVLEEACELVIDCPHTTPKFQETGVRVVRNFNIRNGQFQREPAYFTSEDDYLVRTKRAVPLPGDVLFSREAPVGEACVIPEGERASLGQRTMLIRPKGDQLDPRFFVCSVYSENVRTRMNATASGMTVPHLNVADVRSLQLPAPSLREQLVISAALSTVDDNIDSHQRIRNKLSELFRSLLHQMMTAQIRVTDLDLTALDDISRPDAALQPA